MNINELKEVLNNENMLKTTFWGSTKRFVMADAVYKNGQWSNMPDVFGIYRNADTGDYIFFVTDSERGIKCYVKRKKTEQEACEILYRTMKEEKELNISAPSKETIMGYRRESVSQDGYTYYKFKVGNGGMRRKGVVVEYLNDKGEWVEDFELLRRFIGLDSGFEEISEAEAEELVRNRKKNNW